MQNRFKENIHDNNEWRVILVDADYAFNRNNRLHAQWQARLFWLRASRFINSTYQTKQI